MGNVESNTSKGASASTRKAAESLGEAGLARCREVFGRLGGASSETVPTARLAKHFNNMPLWAMDNLLGYVQRKADALSGPASRSCPPPAPPPSRSCCEQARMSETATDSRVSKLSLAAFSVIMADATSAHVYVRRKLYYSSMASSGLDPAYTEDVLEVVYASLNVAADDAARRARLATLIIQKSCAGKGIQLLGNHPTLDEDGFIRMLGAVPMVETALNSLFSLSWFFSEGLEVPANLSPLSYGPAGVAKASRLLDELSVGVLDGALDGRMRGHWGLLYSSRLHGGSFATMKGKILDEGPTIVVIKDKHDHIFGGFASESWKPTPGFYGTEDSFLFRVEPDMVLFPISGKNKNYQYFNYGKEQLPNGLGMGGQLDYYGLFISDSYDNGHCKGHPLSTTYDSVVLSKESDFLVSEIEVWRVGPLPEPDSDDEDGSGGKKSILQGNAQEKALLALAGIEMKSEGLVEPIEEVVIDPRTGKVKRPVY